jgi:hypothetical protein
MAAKLTGLTQNAPIQLHLLVGSYTICSSRSRRPVLKLLGTPSYSIRFGVSVVFISLFGSVLYARNLRRLCSTFWVHQVAKWDDKYDSVSKSFRTESITKYTLTFGFTRCCHPKTVIAAKLTRLTHKIAIQLHLVAESCFICSSLSRRPVRKLLVTPSYDSFLIAAVLLAFVLSCTHENLTRRKL